MFVVHTQKLLTVMVVPKLICDILCCWLGRHPPLVMLVSETVQNEKHRISYDIIQIKEG